MELWLAKGAVELLGQWAEQSPLVMQLEALGAMRHEQAALQQQHIVQSHRLSELKVQDDRYTAASLAPVWGGEGGVRYISYEISTTCLESSSMLGLAVSPCTPPPPFPRASHQDHTHACMHTLLVAAHSNCLALQHELH